MKTIVVFGAFAFHALCVSRCLAGDTDTDQWMYPILRWAQPEHPLVVADENPQVFKQKQIVVPDLVFHGATFPEAVAILRQASIAADAPAHEGIRFHLADGLTESKADTHITVTFHNVPLSEVALYVASLSGCRTIEAEGDLVFVAQ